MFGGDFFVLFWCFWLVNIHGAKTEWNIPDKTPKILHLIISTPRVATAWKDRPRKAALSPAATSLAALLQKYIPYLLKDKIVQNIFNSLKSFQSGKSFFSKTSRSVQMSYLPGVLSGVTERLAVIES